MTLEQKAQRVRAQLKKYRSNGLVQNVVSKKAGMSKMTIQRYLTLGTMSLDKLQELCDVIGLEIIIREKVEL